MPASKNEVSRYKGDESSKCVTKGYRRPLGKRHKYYDSEQCSLMTQNGLMIVQLRRVYMCYEGYTTHHTVKVIIYKSAAENR